jgi:hypothetical protein
VPVPQPEADARGARGLLSLPDLPHGGGGVFGAGEAVEALAQGSFAAAHVQLHRRERLLASVNIPAMRAGDPARRVTLGGDSGVAAGADGVLRLTLYEGMDVGETTNETRKVGLAERLVYRHPAFALEARLRVVEPQAAAGSPGANVTLEVETWSRHSGGTPVPAPARFGLRVADLARLALRDPRKRSPALPAMALLEAEVGAEELRDAEAYLGEREGAAPRPELRGTSDERLDLLLGTAGWRRFAYRDALWSKAGGDDAARWLALLGLFWEPQRAVPKMTAFAAMNRGAPMMEMAGGAAGQAAAMPMLMAAAAAGGGPDDAVLAMDDAAPAGVDPAGDFAGAAPLDDLQQQQAGDMPEAAQPEPPAADAAADLAVPQFAAAKRVAPGIMMRRPGPGVPGIWNPPVRRSFRVYAHANKRVAKGPRSDFTETVLFVAENRTVCAVGTGAGAATTRCTALLRFQLSDSVTTFRAQADAFDDKGALGACELDFASKLPARVDAMLPAELLFSAATSSSCRSRSRQAAPRLAW